MEPEDCMKAINHSQFVKDEVPTSGFISCFPGFANYDDRLVDVLCQEHRIILTDYLELSYLCEVRHEYRDKALKIFTNQLMNHFVLEDSKFYPFILKGLNAYPASESILQDVAKQAQSTSQKVANFLEKTKQELVTDEDWKNFQPHLIVAGQALRERIDLEENVLHPIYSNLAVQ